MGSGSSWRGEDSSYRSNSYGSGGDYGSRSSFGSDNRLSGGGFGGGYDEYSRRGSRSFGDNDRNYDQNRFGSSLDRNRGGLDRSFGGGNNDRSFGYRDYDRTGLDSRDDYGYGTQSSGWDRGSYGSSYGGSERGSAESGRRGFWDKASDEVSSWFGDRDAERRRERDQYRGRGPKNYARSDDRIRDDVNDRLTDDGWLDASSVEVSVKDREVTLSGTVNDRNAKRRAEDIAEDVSGVSHVQNNLRVKSQVSNTDVNVDRSASATSTADTLGTGTTGATIAKPATGGQR
ncbi:MAG: BON domain-containing protein [Methylobacterium mesophilicum]|nr:BON domain-containing protein [Methylobacterium mesophilicum]